jgi:xanthine dehydrogenase accessory factor
MTLVPPLFASTSPPAGAADHRRILDAAAQWAGAPLAIATVVETWSSAPCPAGTHMLIHHDGRFVGSVSGGCVEGDVLATAATVISDGQAQLRRYGISNAAAWEAGLPCGGDIVVLVQKVGESGFSPSLFPTLINARNRGETLLVASDLVSGKSEIVPAPVAGLFNAAYPPARRALIVGAVEIAAALAGVAAQLDIAVTLIDPRARFLTVERFPGVVLDDRWPDEAIAALVPDARTAVVTLSHDPKIDDPALIAALASPAAYVAALGSRKSHAARLDRLRGQGISADQLARIEGPAGVTINAISAPEIALSIAGGMIRAFNHGLR